MPVKIEFNPRRKTDTPGVAEERDGVEARLEIPGGIITALSSVENIPRRGFLGILGLIGLTEKVVKVRTKFPGDSEPVEVLEKMGGGTVGVRHEVVTSGVGDALIIHGWGHVSYSPDVSASDTHD